MTLDKKGLTKTCSVLKRMSWCDSLAYLAIPFSSRAMEVAKKSRAFLNSEDDPRLDNEPKLSIFILRRAPGSSVG